MRDCGDGELVTLVDTHQIIDVSLCGGSGFGAPAERDPGAVEADIAEGYVSPEAAARDYRHVRPGNKTGAIKK